MEHPGNQELLQRITIDPAISFGKPCVRGTRFAVIHVLDYVDSGMTDEEILQDFPYLQQEDLDACRLYREMGFPLVRSALKGE
jgi:uncharacterized protein (DUF433 family)